MGKSESIRLTSNLALDTQKGWAIRRVVVSGYVLPGLQVKYGVGIFDSLATLALRYLADAPESYIWKRCLA